MVQSGQHPVVFLFGAGASKGAGHIRPCDPPLGTEVYDRLAEHFPREWGPGSPMSRYHEGLRQDFEKTMFNEVCLWNPSLSILEWQRPMALYFSRFTPDSTGEDLYSRLLVFLQATGQMKNSIFASLNYDCIFEQAACGLGLHVDYSGGDAGEHDIRVPKVHGSCNFITENMERSRPHLSSPGSAVGGNIDYLQPIGIEQVLTAKFSHLYAPYYPIMSIYAFGKNTIVAGERIQKIRNIWAQYVIHAPRVIVIGVRPNSDDSHIWTPIQETSAHKLLYVGAESDFHIWKTANSHFEYLGERFYEAFDSLLESLH